MARKHHDANARRERGKTRRARDPEPAIVGCSGKWVAPPKEEWIREEPEYPDAVAGDAIIRYRRETWSDELVDWAIILMCKGEDGEWHDVVRYDCEHECVHRHRFDRGGNDIEPSAPLRAIDAIHDVREGFNDADSEIHAIWQDEQRRWQRAKR